MKYDPNSEEELLRMATLIEEINAQSDRGAAIVGAACLEESMSAALESFLHSHPRSWQRLFAGNRALGTFSVKKIYLSRLLGLITDVTCRPRSVCVTGVASPVLCPPSIP